MTAQELAEADRRVMEALKAPVPPELVRTRQGKAGMQYRFIKADTLCDLLDERLGPENWSNAIEVDPAGHWVRQTITVYLPSGKIVMRSSLADIQFEGDGGRAADFPLKTADSNALKRAGERLGVARDIEEESNPDYNGPRRPQTPQQQPRRGQWGVGPSQQPPRPQQPPQRPQQGPGSLPRSGKALFAWAKERNLVDWFQTWGGDFGLPDRLVEWSEDDVAAGLRAYAEAVAASRPEPPAQAVAPARGDAYEGDDFEGF